MELYNKIVASLPREPSDDVKFWATDEEILSRTEEGANAIADLLDSTGEVVAVTGFYDPAEDERDGMVDALTGFYYVSI